MGKDLIHRDGSSKDTLTGHYLGVYVYGYYAPLLLLMSSSCMSTFIASNIIIYLLRLLWNLNVPLSFRWERPWCCHFSATLNSINIGRASNA